MDQKNPWMRPVLFFLGLALNLGCGGQQWAGTIAGHTLTHIESAYFEVIDEGGLLGIGITLAEETYSCAETKTILSNEGDPVDQDDSKEVAFVHFQVLNLLDDGNPGAEHYDIFPDLTSLQPESSIALAQIRLRHGAGYALIAQLEAYEGSLDLRDLSDNQLTVEFDFETPEGIVEGFFDATHCPDLGGEVATPEDSF